MMEKLREALETLNGRNYLVPWDLEERLAEEGEHGAWLAVTEAARRVLDADLEYVLAEAVNADGAHHKQWWLEHIAGVFGINLPDHEPGIAP